MKLTTILLLLVVPLAASPQSLPPSPASIAVAQPGSSPTLPPYLVYRHFLARVNELDKQATAAGATDPYQFAQPFSGANLQHPHLDILRAAAHQLDADLAAQKAVVAVIVARYRSAASASPCSSTITPRERAGKKLELLEKADGKQTIIATSQ